MTSVVSSIRGWLAEATRNTINVTAAATDNLGATAVRVGVIETAVLGGQKFACRQKLLLSQQSG